jgi:hypothetical protein
MVASVRNAWSSPLGRIRNWTFQPQQKGKFVLTAAPDAGMTISLVARQNPKCVFHLIPGMGRSSALSSE